MFQRILVPLDGSEHSKQALPFAVDLARQSGGTIVLAQAVHTSFAALPDSYMATPDIYEQMMTQARSEAVANLQAVADELAAQGVKVETVVLEGEPATEIIDYEDQGQIDLVVMSTHGRSGLTRFVYGSVAERVLRHGTKPVLLIRIPEERRR